MMRWLCGFVGLAAAFAFADPPRETIPLSDADFSRLNQLAIVFTQAQSDYDRAVTRTLDEIATANGINRDCSAGPCYAFDDRRNAWRLANPGPQENPSTTTTVPPAAPQ